MANVSRVQFEEKMSETNWTQNIPDNQGRFLHDSSCVSADSIKQIVLYSFFFFPHLSLL